MKQFYETYRSADPILATLLRELSWSHNVRILGRCKSTIEREFYLKLTVKERWTIRDLERQLNGALFERVALSAPKVSTALAEIYPDATTIFRDSYLVEFLELSQSHTEADLQHTLVSKLRAFLLELGRDFTFVGENYLLQVGNRDFRKAHERPSIGVLPRASKDNEVVECAGHMSAGRPDYALPSRNGRVDTAVGAKLANLMFYAHFKGTKH